jgi:hypothetical protein
MVISGKSYREGFKDTGKSEYKNYFNGFLKAINSSKKLKPNKKKEIISKITNDNPKQFLRIL